MVGSGLVSVAASFFDSGRGVSVVTGVGVGVTAGCAVVSVTVSTFFSCEPWSVDSVSAFAGFSAVDRVSVVGAGFSSFPGETFFIMPGSGVDSGIGSGVAVGAGSGSVCVGATLSVVFAIAVSGVGDAVGDGSGSEGAGVSVTFAVVVSVIGVGSGEAVGVASGVGSGDAVGGGAIVSAIFATAVSVCGESVGTADADSGTISGAAFGSIFIGTFRGICCSAGSLTGASGVAVGVGSGWVAAF